MWHKYNLVLWSLASLAWIYPACCLSVSATDSYCEHKGEVLFCDYKDATQGDVSMMDIGKEDLKKVFLYNINELTLSDSICVNMALHNVKLVKVSEEGGNVCNKEIELSAKKSNLDKIPGSIKGLYLEESTLKLLETDASFSKLNVISSTINTFNMKKSFVNGTKAIIQDTKVTTLQMIVIGSGTSLLVQKSTINTENKNSMLVINGQVKVKDSTITGPEGNVVLFSGGIFTVGSPMGEMTVSAGQCTSEQSGASCQRDRTFLVLFVLFLVLFVASWILIAVLHRETLSNFILKRGETDKSTAGDNTENEEKHGLLRAIASLRSKNPAVANSNNDQKTSNKATDVPKSTIHGRSALETVEKIQRELTVQQSKYRRDNEANEANIAKQELTQENHEAEGNKKDVSKDKKKKVKKDKHNSKDSDNIPIPALKESDNILSRDISVYFKRTSCSCKFLEFLQQNKITVVSSLLNASQEERDKEEASINSYNCSEKNSEQYEKTLKKYENTLHVLLSLITNEYDQKACEKQLGMESKMIENFHKLHKQVQKKEFKETLSYFSKEIKERTRNFQLEIQKLFHEDIINNVHQTEKTLTYMINTIRNSETEIPQTTVSILNEDEQSQEPEQVFSGAKTTPATVATDNSPSNP